MERSLLKVPIEIGAIPNLGEILDFGHEAHEPSHYLTLVLPSESFVSIRSKIGRVFREQEFVNSHHHRFDRLTRREKEILTLVATGMNNPQIAEALFISRKTVEQHRKNLNRKLEITCLPDLIRYAQAFDLV